MSYPQKDIRYGHYGKTIEHIIKRVAEETDTEKQQKQIVALANLMKKTYLAWNRDTVKDEVIAKQLEELSDGKLTLKDPSALEATASLLSTIKTRNTGGHKRKKGKSKNRRKRR
jgi:hypothetical protein